jgi:hypothetical protein
MAAVARNMPCPCGSGRKYKQCCLRGAANPRLGAPHGTPLRTIDATGHGCRWTIYAAAAPEEAGAPGEFVEHHCTGERFMASKVSDGCRTASISRSSRFLTASLPNSAIGLCGSRWKQSAMRT